MITFIFRLHSVTFLKLLKVRCKNKVKRGNLGITIISRQFLCSTDLQKIHKCSPHNEVYRVGPLILKLADEIHRSQVFPGEGGGRGLARTRGT